MSQALVVISLGVQTLTLLTLVLAMARRLQDAREERKARAEATIAAQNAARSAALAHEAIGAVADNVLKIELATNSMKDALVASTATASDLAGEKRGIAIGVAQQAAKGEQK